MRNHLNTPSRMALSAVTATALLLAGAASGCSSDDAEPAKATLHIQVTIAPDPPAMGKHTLTIQVTDEAAQPVTGAAVTVHATMPAMGHGSTEEPVVTDKGAGKYEATPLTFQMPGTWRVTVKASKAAAAGELATTYEVK